MERPSDHLSVLQRLRAGHVRRWHIVAMAREQTIAEHSHRVQTITHAILEAMNRYDWGDSLCINAMEWARVHDMAEAVVGDMPTNAKQFIRNELDGADLLEELADRTDLNIAELRVCVEEDCPLAGAIVKLADLAEATNWVQIFGLGAHARSVAARLKTATFDHLDKTIAMASFRPETCIRLRDLISSVITPEGNT